MAKVDSDIDNKGGGTGRTIKSTVKVGKTPIAGKPAPSSQPEDKIAGAGLMSKTITADPRLEYVASGGYLWLNHYLRSLPWYIDDIQRDFGIDIYERMLLDPAVFAAFNTLKASILREGVEILPAEDLADPKAPPAPSITGKRPRQSSPEAHEIAAFCKRNLDKLARPLTSLLYEMLDGAAFGNKIGEMIFNDAAVEEVKSTDPETSVQTTSTRIVQTLKTIKVKPRTSTAFVVDTYANVVGLLGLIPGQGYPVIVQGLMGKPGDVPNMLPREKFCIFTWQPKDEDPRGTSALRPAYAPWWFKQQVLGERLKFIVRFATPSLYGRVPDMATPVPLTDGNGNPIINPTTGLPVVQTAQAAMQNSLLGFQNGTVAVGAYGSELDVIESKSEGGAFKEFQNDCDRDIARAITYQTLATGEAQEGHLGSGGGADAHQDILELPVNYGKKMLADMIANDILRLIVVQNYGEAALPLLPVVSLGDVESHNFAEMATPLGTLGYSLDQSQFEGIDSDLGMPARAEGWQERQAKETAALKQPATKEPATSGKGK